MHVQHDFHIRWCSCHLKITRLLPLVKQELFTFPEHVSPFRFSFGSCWLIFSFTWSVLWTIVSLSSVLLLIILSVLWLAAHHIVCPMIVRSSYCLSYDWPLIILSVLWLAASDYTFGVLKLFLYTLKAWCPIRVCTKPNTVTKNIDLVYRSRCMV